MWGVKPSIYAKNSALGMDLAIVEAAMQRQVFTEVRAMDNQQYQGLCTTCIHAPVCRSAKNSDSPVIYCEEFEYRLPPMSINAEKSADTAPKAPDRVTETRTDPSLKGLCINCENRKTCTLPRPEGGVWHCEEYR